MAADNNLDYSVVELLGLDEHHGSSLGYWDEYSRWGDRARDGKDGKDGKVEKRE